MPLSRDDLKSPSTRLATPYRRSRIEKWREAASDHFPLLILMCIAMFPLFYDLGDDYLWSDEGDTAVLARSILEYGVPKAWDGVTFSDSDMGARVNEDFVMVSHPWLQYYVTAASFCFFADNAFAARFPFALAGLCTIPILYLLILRMTSDRKAALCACILLLFSVQFLLFSRQSRNYALSMALTCLLLRQFFDLNSWRRALGFALTAVLLFHCHPSGLAPIGVLVFLTVIYKPFRRTKRWLWLSVPIIAALTLPWFALAREGYHENTSILKDWGLFAPRLLQFFIECGSVTPVVGIIALSLWLWFRSFRQHKFHWSNVRRLSHEMFSGEERHLVIVVLSLFAAYGALIALTVSRSELWTVGLRHTTAIIPLTFGVAGLLVSKVSRRNKGVFLVLLILLSVTKLGRLTPWSFLHSPKVEFRTDDIASMHVPSGWKNKLLRTALPAFSRELWRRNPGAVTHICEFLKTNAAPGEVLITNYEWEPLYFHTRLPQGLKILPTYPIYEKVQQHGLPYYVYTVKDARWIVWRWPWNGYRDYDFKVVYNALVESGATLVKVGSIRETGWENQPNIHFRRFPGKDYKFPFYSNMRDVEIFRVDWPWTKSKNPAASPEQVFSPPQQLTPPQETKPS